MHRKHFKSLLKLSLSLGLVFFALKNVKIQEVLNVFTQIHLVYFALATTITIGRNWIAALRWRLLLHVNHKQFSASRLTGIYMESCFYNMFLPTSIGGDIMRVIRVGKMGPGLLSSASTIFIERVIGVVAYALIGAGAYFYSSMYGSTLGKTLLVSCLSFVLIVGVAAVLLPHFYRAGFFKIKKPQLQDFISTISHVKTIFKVLLLSFVFHFSKILSTFLLAFSLGIPIAFRDVMFFTPIVELLCFLPISTNGMGVRENSFMYLLANIGIAYSQSFALSTMSSLQLIIMGLVGGLVILKNKMRKTKNIKTTVAA